LTGSDPTGDQILLNAIDAVLGKVGGLADPALAKTLTERAHTLKDIILDWASSPPSASERDDIASKVLGLHVTLSHAAKA
jgi:hypothetical protein